MNNTPISPDVFTLGVLAGLLLLSIGALVGYIAGKNHRRTTYRQIRKGLENEVKAWKAAYKDAIGRIRRNSPL